MQLALHILVVMAGIDALRWTAGLSDMDTL